ncbi:hypothetical protein AOL_s00188g245 [Orbilia oligospora ATCC 24927]|uniref:Uncharacterized protein n=1 Tax=Arthrobotrys oligospora (strain ATCC 24927 / CBS 115.81 / DSM 1491) TaxID=756982 RepID=G1XQN3_ARTOA|nr:hypothetical protein AOL_s00188g245 [Orbilia oligospora ATCC 24927]EGX44577.1 hypothetical protein AOL_s00188g245 [Orbilia oligospora ATCC 24927]
MHQSIPPEIQDLILEAAGGSQYPVLRLVCKRWNISITRIFQKKYRALPNTDDAEIKKYFGKSHKAPGPELTPFLLHEAICDFTGYVRTSQDWSGITENIYPIDINFGPEDDPDVVAETLRLYECGNDPVIIADANRTDALRYPVYIGWALSDPESVALAALGGGSGHSFLATKNATRTPGPDYDTTNLLNPRKIMKIRDFVSLYVQYTRHSRGYPPLAAKGGKFVVHTGMWAPFYADATPETMESVKYIKINIVHMGKP